MICFWKIKKLEEKCCVLKIKLDRSNVFDRWSVMNRTVGIDNWIDEPTDLSRFRVNQMVQKPPYPSPTSSSALAAATLMLLPACASCLSRAPPHPSSAASLRLLFTLFYIHYYLFYFLFFIFFTLWFLKLLLLI